MKVLVVVIIAAIALAVAFGAYIKNDRAWKRVNHAWRARNDRLENENVELERAKKIGERRLADQAKEIDALASELRAKSKRLADAEERREHYKELCGVLFETLDRKHKEGIVIPVDGRKVYFERDGIRHIFIDNDYQGWYDPEHETVECVPHPSAAPTPSPEGRQGMTNYRWIRGMSVEEMADFLGNYEEYAAKACDPKYCNRVRSDGFCAPAPEGMPRSESCRAATVKWLRGLHAEPGTETGGKEGPGEERQPAEPAEATEATEE